MISDVTWFIMEDLHAFYSGTYLVNVAISLCCSIYERIGTNRFKVYFAHVRRRLSNLNNNCGSKSLALQKDAKR